MTLLCIGSGDWYDTVTDRSVPGPAFGEEVTAIGETTAFNLLMGGTYETWLLEEWPDPTGYNKEAFVVVGGDEQIDEAEKVKEEELETA